jgi:hypothetical protein
MFRAAHSSVWFTSRAVVSHDGDRVQALEEHERDLRQAADAEHEDEDREEGELGHGVGAREQGIEQPRDEGRAPHEHPEQHAAGRGQREAAQRALERDPGFEQEIPAREEPAELQRDVLERRKEERAPQAAARGPLPGDQRDGDEHEPHWASPCQASSWARAARSRRSPA